MFQKSIPFKDTQAFKTFVTELRKSILTDPQFEEYIRSLKDGESEQNHEITDDERMDAFTRLKGSIPNSEKQVPMGLDLLAQMVKDLKTIEENIDLNEEFNPDRQNQASYEKANIAWKKVVAAVNNLNGIPAKASIDPQTDEEITERIDGNDNPLFESVHTYLNGANGEKNYADIQTKPLETKTLLRFGQMTSDMMTKFTIFQRQLLTTSFSREMRQADAEYEKVVNDTNTFFTDLNDEQKEVLRMSDEDYNKMIQPLETEYNKYSDIVHRMDDTISLTGLELDKKTDELFRSISDTDGQGDWAQEQLDNALKKEKEKVYLEKKTLFDQEMQEALEKTRKEQLLFQKNEQQAYAEAKQRNDVLQLENERIENEIASIETKLTNDLNTISNTETREQAAENKWKAFGKGGTYQSFMDELEKKDDELKKLNDEIAEDEKEKPIPEPPKEYADRVAAADAETESLNSLLQSIAVNSDNGSLDAFNELYSIKNEEKRNQISAAKETVEREQEWYSLLVDAKELLNGSNPVSEDDPAIKEYRKQVNDFVAALKADIEKKGTLTFEEESKKKEEEVKNAELAEQQKEKEAYKAAEARNAEVEEYNNKCDLEFKKTESEFNKELKALENTKSRETIEAEMWQAFREGANRESVIAEKDKNVETIKTLVNEISAEYAELENPAVAVPSDKYQKSVDAADAEAKALSDFKERVNRLGSPDELNAIFAFTDDGEKAQRSALNVNKIANRERELNRRLINGMQNPESEDAALLKTYVENFITAQKQAMLEQDRREFEKKLEEKKKELVDLKVNALLDEQEKSEPVLESEEHQKSVADAEKMLLQLSAFQKKITKLTNGNPAAFEAVIRDNAERQKQKEAFRNMNDALKRCHEQERVLKSLDHKKDKKAYNEAEKTLASLKKSYATAEKARNKTPGSDLYYATVKLYNGNPDAYNAFTAELEAHKGEENYLSAFDCMNASVEKLQNQLNALKQEYPEQYGLKPSKEQLEARQQKRLQAKNALEQQVITDEKFKADFETERAAMTKEHTNQLKEKLSKRESSLRNDPQLASIVVGRQKHQAAEAEKKLESLDGGAKMYLAIVGMHKSNDENQKKIYEAFRYELSQHKTDGRPALDCLDDVIKAKKEAAKKLRQEFPEYYDLEPTKEQTEAKEKAKLAALEKLEQKKKTVDDLHNSVAAAESYLEKVKTEVDKAPTADVLKEQIEITKTSAEQTLSNLKKGKKEKEALPKVRSDDDISKSVSAAKETLKNELQSKVNQQLERAEMKRTDPNTINDILQYRNGKVVEAQKKFELFGADGKIYTAFTDWMSKHKDRFAEIRQQINDNSEKGGVFSYTDCINDVIKKKSNAAYKLKQEYSKFYKVEPTEEQKKAEQKAMEELAAKKDKAKSLSDRIESIRKFEDKVKDEIKDVPTAEDLKTRAENLKLSANEKKDKLSKQKKTLEKLPTVRTEDDINKRLEQEKEIVTDKQKRTVNTAAKQNYNDNLSNTKAEIVQTYRKNMEEKQKTLKGRLESKTLIRRKATDLADKQTKASERHNAERAKLLSVYGSKEERKPEYENNYPEWLRNQANYLARDIRNGTKPGHKDSPEFLAMEASLTAVTSFLANDVNRDKLRAGDPQTIDTFRQTLNNLNTQTENYTTKKEKGIHWIPSNMYFTRMQFASRLKKFVADEKKNLTDLTTTEVTRKNGIAIDMAKRPKVKAATLESLVNKHLPAVNKNVVKNDPAANVNKATQPVNQPNQKLQNSPQPSQSKVLQNSSQNPPQLQSQHGGPGLGPK